ncbi:protein OCTOPUS-like [Cornus florida]|uniref:protein OCTOPUS-like n=1 Tax=Cornus florida TaxID=4283 RepID=UPI00289717A2|nr:protein OCTOPUS-like [Cornus florida]
MTLEPYTRRLSNCYRHPAEPVTGFCASCLRERLAGIDPSGLPEPSSSTSSSTVTATTSLKSVLSNSGGGRADRAGHRKIASSSFSPELRRSKSVAVHNCEASSGLSEPRRNSCEARVPNSLLNLFLLDDKRKRLDREPEVESKNLGFSGLTDPVPELVGEDENEDKTRVAEDVLGQNVDDERAGDDEEELKTVKELIDLELQRKKQMGMDLKDIAGSFRAAASVFSKKLRKWKRKQKGKKYYAGANGGGGGGGDLLTMRVEKPNGWQLRETQSEIGDYGFGRRSCDVDRRFSVDGGRMSLDDPRFSFDEHRASWDGYLIARTIPRLTPMLSVVENAMMAPVNRSDNRRWVEEQMMNSINEDETTSGGSAQTRDYYWDSSSSQRRSSFDGSSSMKSSNKKTSALEGDEMKTVLNSKVSPATIDIFHGTKLLITEREMGNLNSNSFKDDQLESIESASKKATFVASGGNPKEVKKHGRWRKVWNFWGSRQGLIDSKYGDVGENVIDQSLGELYEKQAGEADGIENEARGEKVIRSSSCVNSRSSDKMIGSHGSMRSVTETRGCVPKIKEDFVLDKNRSGRYSPSNFDNGLLRFYLTPTRSYNNKSGKSRLKNSQSSASSVLRLD